MATQITITADAQQAKSELLQVADEVQRLGANAAEAADFADVLADALEGQAAWEKATNGARDFEIEIEKLERDLPPLNEEIHKLKTRLDSVGEADTVAKLNAAFNGISAMMEVGRKLQEVFTKAREKIRELAESGNQDFARLNDSINKIGTSFDSFLDRVSQSSAGGSAINAMAEQIDDVAGGVESLPDLWDSVRTAALEASHAINSYVVSADSESTRLHYRRMQQIQQEMEARTEAHEAELRRREREADENATQQIERDLAKQRAIEQEQAAVKEINNRGAINAAIDKELSAMRELAAERKLSDEEREDFQRRIMQLESRGRELERDAHNERMRHMDELRREQEDWMAWQEAQQQEALQRQIAAAEQARAIERQRHEEEIALVRAGIAERERLQQESLERQRQAYEEHVKRLQKGFEDGGTVDAIQEAANDPQAMARRLAQNRSGATEGREFQQAFRQAMQQLVGGGRQRGGPSFSDDELRAAQMDNTKAQFENLRANSSLSRESIDALARATVEQRKQSDEMNELNRQVEEIKRQINATSQDGERRRSQRMGGRQ